MLKNLFAAVIVGTVSLIINFPPEIGSCSCSTNQEVEHMPSFTTTSTPTTSTPTTSTPTTSTPTTTSTTSTTTTSMRGIQFVSFEPTMAATIKTTTTTKTTTTRFLVKPTITITDSLVTNHGHVTYQTISKNVQGSQNPYLKIGMTILAILLVILFISLGLLKAFKERYNTLIKCEFLSRGFS